LLLTVAPEIMAWLQGTLEGFSTAKDIADIRRQYKAGETTQQIGTRYGNRRPSSTERGASPGRGRKTVVGGGRLGRERRRDLADS
jgi:hypothetical protein